MNRLIPTQAETVRLIEETSRNGRALDLSFGPRGAWIEWAEGEAEPWAATFLRKLRGEPLVAVTATVSDHPRGPTTSAARTRRGARR